MALDCDLNDGWYFYPTDAGSYKGREYYFVWCVRNKKIVAVQGSPDKEWVIKSYVDPNKTPSEGEKHLIAHVLKDWEIFPSEIGKEVEVENNLDPEPNLNLLSQDFRSFLEKEDELLI